jgi:hypothetical protein
LNGKKFINWLKFWKPVDTDKVVAAIRDIKPLDVNKVLGSNTEIFVRLFDVGEKKISDSIEYNSHNTSHLNFKNLQNLLKKQDFIKNIIKGK